MEFLSVIYKKLPEVDCILNDLDLLVGQPVQLVDDFVNQVVGALDLLVEFLCPLDCLAVPF